MVTIADTLMEEGIERGRLQGTREGIIEILKSRFSVAPPPFEDTIESIQDLVTLKILLRKAAQADSLESFQYFLDEMPK
jgi:hypothetical protein